MPNFSKEYSCYMKLSNKQLAIKERPINVKTLKKIPVIFWSEKRIIQKGQNWEKKNVTLR